MLKESWQSVSEQEQQQGTGDPLLGALLLVMPVVVATMTLASKTFVVVLAACEVTTLLHELDGLVQEFLLLLVGGLAQAKRNVIVKLKL